MVEKYVTPVPGTSSGSGISELQLATYLAMQGLLASGNHEGTAPNELAKLARTYAEATVRMVS
jgi:hypothetical protein